MLLLRIAIIDHSQLRIGENWQNRTVAFGPKPRGLCRQKNVGLEIRSPSHRLNRFLLFIRERWDELHLEGLDSAGRLLQAHEKNLGKTATPLFAGHAVQLGWHGRDGKKFAEERRELTAYNLPGVKDHPHIVVGKRRTGPGSRGVVVREVIRIGRGPDDFNAGFCAVNQHRKVLHSRACARGR